jgi:hypothetical protein
MAIATLAENLNLRLNCRDHVEAGHSIRLARAERLMTVIRAPVATTAEYADAAADSG